MAIDYIAMLSCYLKGSQSTAVLAGQLPNVEMTAAAIAPGIQGTTNLLMHDQGVAIVVPKTLEQFQVHTIRRIVHKYFYKFIALCLIKQFEVYLPQSYHVNN